MRTRRALSSLTLYSDSTLLEQNIKAVLPLFKIKYPEIKSENSWNFTKYPEILTKGSSLLYQLYMMLFFSEGKGNDLQTISSQTHRLFHGIPCNRYIFNSNILKKFLKTPEFWEKWNAASLNSDNALLALN